MKNRGWNRKLLTGQASDFSSCCRRRWSRNRSTSPSRNRWSWSCKWLSERRKRRAGHGRRHLAPQHLSRLRSHVVVALCVGRVEFRVIWWGDDTFIVEIVVRRTASVVELTRVDSRLSPEGINTEQYRLRKILYTSLWVWSKLPLTKFSSGGAQRAEEKRRGLKRAAFGCLIVPAR